MTEIIGEYTNPLITKCKNYGIKYLKEIIKKHKIIANIKITKTEINKLNKTKLLEFIVDNNIDIDKYKKDKAFEMKNFYFEIGYYSLHSDISQSKYKNINGVLNYFIRNNLMGKIRYNDDPELCFIWNNN
jgi:hypothetical protein